MAAVLARCSGAEHGWIRFRPPTGYPLTAGCSSDGMPRMVRVGGGLEDAARREP